MKSNEFDFVANYSEITYKFVQTIVGNKEI